MNIESLDDRQIYEKFKDYLVFCGYKEFTTKGSGSTAFNYPTRISYIVWYENYKSCIDVIKNIKCLLKEYDIGGLREEIGQKSHASVINALKRFNEFLVYAQKYMNIYSSHLLNNDNSIELVQKEKEIKQKTNKQIKNINKLFTLIIHDEYGDEMTKVYISDKDLVDAANRILPTTPLANVLLGKSIGDVFKINETEYTLKDIQELEE